MNVHLSWLLTQLSKKHHKFIIIQNIINHNDISVNVCYKIHENLLFNVYTNQLLECYQRMLNKSTIFKILSFKINRRLAVIFITSACQNLGHEVPMFNPFHEIEYQLKW